MNTENLLIILFGLAIATRPLARSSQITIGVIVMIIGFAFGLGIINLS